ncbi:MAG: DUF998 domain-containing protein, partial [Halobacteriota archaeon]
CNTTSNLCSLQLRTTLNPLALHATIMNYKNAAGALLFVGGVLVFMGIVTAEATYPGYNTHTNYISDLGGTQPPASIIKQPAATIFAATLAVTGVLTLVSAYCVYRGLERRRSVTAFSILLALSGISAIGNAVFNQSTEGSFVVHAGFGFLGFTVGGLAVIISYGFLRRPFRYFAAILGIVALASFWLPIVLDVAIGVENPVSTFLGPGGLERWAAYPRTLWTIGFAGYLMGYSDVEEVQRSQRAPL